MKVQIIAVGVLVVLLSAASGFADTLGEYDPNRTEQHTILMSASPYVTKTPSGNSALALPGTPVEIEDFVVGTTPGNTDPSYDYSPPHNIYAYMITDPCTSGPKKKAMIDTGNHNTETAGSWAFQGMVDFFASADPEADWLRKHVEFYIYPLVNPDGRYTATGRGNPEMTAEGFGTDHNRVWHTCGQGLSTIDALTVAMRADTCNDVDFAFDYHGGGSDFFYIMPSQADCPYVKAFAKREPSVGPHLRSGDYRMLRIWPLRPEGLNAEFSCTPENHKNTGTVQDKLDLGKNYGLAIYDVLIEDDPTADYLELKEESENWLINNLEPAQLIAHWNFDDDDANDSSGNEHHGTLMGDANIVNDPCMGKVLELDGDDDYVNCGQGTWADIQGKITVAAWIKVNEFDKSWQTVFAKGNSTYRLHRASSNDYMTFWLNTFQEPDCRDATGTVDVNDGKWHHVAGVFGGDMVYLYVDGVVDGVTTFTGGSINTNTYDVLIGKNAETDSRQWNGWIDDVRLYNCSLSEDEITALARRFSDPVAWWKLDESGVSTAADSTGNGHTGTLHNNPTWQPSGGQLDGALSFDEVDDYVTVTDFDYTNESDEFSLGFWFKLADVNGSGYQYVFSHGLEMEYNNLDIYFRESEQSNPGTLTTRIRLNAGDKWQVSTPAALADGQWHMYTITVSSVDGATIYIDDESVLTNSAIKGASFNPGTALYLGVREDLNPDRHYGSPAADDGLLDDVRIYDYVLTLGEIERMYQDAKGIIPPEFVCSSRPAGDLNDDCKVNFLDFQILAADWLKGIVYDEGVSVNEFFSSYYSPAYEAIDATWTHMLGGGDNRVLVVALIAEDDDVNNLAIASVKYNNVEMNIVPDSNVIATSDPNKVKTVLYYLLEADLPEPGYYTVAALYAANDVAQRLGGSVSRANVAQQPPEAVATNSNTGQDTISTDITTVTANAWVVDVVAGDDQGSFSTTTGGMTEWWDVSGGVSTRGSTAAGATKSPASAGLTTMSWSYSSGTYMLAHSVAAFETLD